MSLMVDMAMDNVKRGGQYDTLLGNKDPNDRFRRGGFTDDGIIRGSKNQRDRFNVFLKAPTEKRKRLTSEQPLGLGVLSKSTMIRPMGESFARMQSGVSSKSRIVGGGRFDYNAPSQGYFYGEK